MIKSMTPYHIMRICHKIYYELIIYSYFFILHTHNTYIYTKTLTTLKVYMCILHENNIAFSFFFLLINQPFY